jgi:arylsulfatase A-like enzyme
LTHIPLIVKYPAFAGLGGEEARVVQLHDLFATILDLLNCPLPVPVSSTSLLDSPRPYAFAELADSTLSIHLNALKRADPDFIPETDLMQACQGIVDQGLHKLIRWADGRQELYDLKQDYGEVDNLINDPLWGGVRADLASHLTEELGPGPIPDP